MLFSRNKKVIGIYTCEDYHAAVLLQFDPKEKKPIILRFAIVPQGDEEQPLGDSLRILIRKLRTRCRTCALSCWPDGARLKFFEAPKDADTERLRAQLRIGNTTVLNERFEAYTLDCDKLGQFKGPEGKAHFISCGVPDIQRKNIEAAFSSLGLELQILQLSPVSLFNAFAISHDDVLAKQPYLVADIAKNRTIIIGGYQKQLPLVRILDIGWGNVDEMFGGESEMPSDLLQVLTETGGPEMAELQRSSGMLVSELRRSANFLEIDHGVKLKRIYLSGTLAPHAPMAQMIATDLDIPFEHWNPFRRGAASEDALGKFGLLSEFSRLCGAAGAAFQVLL